jgi:hypothetical protein
MLLIGTRKFPKGPDLKRSEQHSISVSGTRIAFSAPPHDAIQATPPLSGSFNLYDASHFGRFNKTDQVEPASFTLELKDWRFNGIPLLDGTGVIGDMKFKVSIVSMPEFASLFHPRHLECAVERYIYTAYTAYRIPGECRQNWRVIKINGKEWVNYESMGYPGYRNAEECYESVWHTPITDQHLLTVRFDQVIRKKRTRLAEIYESIIDRVMNSFEIQLSSDAQSQQQYIRQKFPNEGLSKNLPPYEFEEFELDNEYELIGNISAQHNFELPHEKVKRLWEIEKKRQRQMQKETRARVVESHLRFKSVESGPPG